MFTEKIVWTRQQAPFYLENNSDGNGMYTEHNDFNVEVQMLDTSLDISIQLDMNYRYIVLS